jgi:hypothetical protein
MTQQGSVAARNLLGRLAPHVASADNWSEDLDFWIGAALSFEGLKALGVPDAQLKTFPLPFQQGMAARADPRQRLDFALIVERRLRRPDRFADDLPRQTKVTSDRLDRLTRCMLTPNPNHCLHDQHPVLAN